MRLRPYQRRDAIRLFDGLFSGTPRRLLYVLPTGGGKTDVAVAVIRAAVEGERRVLFFAHRRELIAQAHDRLAARGMPKSKIGILLGGDERVRPDAPVQVASVQTLNRRKLPRADLIVVDEAHHATSESYQKILEYYPTVPVLGLTATPFRLDGKGLGDVFDELVLGPTVRELAAMPDVLALPRVLTVADADLPDISKVRKTAGEYNRADLEEEMARRPRRIGNARGHYVKHANGRLAVLFAVNVEDSKNACADFNANGIAAEHVDAKTTTEERAAILARLRSGETKVLTNVDIVTEGWDLPELGCVICIRPTASLALWLQMCGRAMRAKSERPIVLDHAGNVHRLGVPQDEREYSLEGVTTTGERKGVAPYKRCPDCEEAVPTLTATCEGCGHVFYTGEPPAELTGELVEARGLLPCSVEGCKTMATRVSSVYARKGGKAYCEQHSGGRYARKPLLTCSAEGCSALATRSSSNGARLKENKAYCEQHKIDTAPKPPLPCSAEGCSALATRRSSHNARSLRQKPYCEQHSGGRKAPKPLLPCGAEGCNALATNRASIDARCRGGKAYCEQHSGGRRAPKPLLPCGVEGCNRLATKQASARSRHRGDKAYCEQHKGGRITLPEAAE